MDAEPELEQVLAQAASGDEDAWTGIVDRYAPLVSSVVRRHRLYGEDAHDVFQTVWLRLVERLDSLREPEALPGWLVTTTRHECLRVLRVRQRDTATDPTILAETTEAPDGHESDEGLLRAERHEALLAGLAELPDRQRELLRLMLLDPPLSYADIAERLGVSVGYIGPTRARALARLRATTALHALERNPGHGEAGGARHDDDPVG